MERGLRNRVSKFEFVRNIVMKEVEMERWWGSGVEFRWIVF